MTRCIRCDAEIRQTDYCETGEEFYCSCQNTLQAEFDSSLWIIEEKRNEE